MKYLAKPIEFFLFSASMTEIPPKVAWFWHSYHDHT